MLRFAAVMSPVTEELEMKNESKLMSLAVLAMLTTATWTTSANAETIMSRQCRVDQVAVFANRIHLKCNVDPGKAYTGDIRYYAAAITADARTSIMVESIVALAIAAKQTNKPMVIGFDMDDYRSVPGCQGSDCRKLVSAALE